jgi:C-terminal processing protease CtpA/Prc
VKLTTSRYFTPSGASIHGKGIIPDLVTDGPEETPAELSSGKPLLPRDREVRIALDTLKARVPMTQAHTLPVSYRTLVP